MRCCTLLLLGCVGALLGCKEAAPGARADAAPSAVAVAAQAPDAGSRVLSKRRERAVHPLPRVKAVTPGVHELSEGTELRPQAVVLHKGQSLVLDFSAGARVHLRGPCIAEPAVTALDGLLVRDCTLSVDLTPAAATPDSGFLLTTPSAAFSLVRSGRFALRSFANGTTVARVVSGTVSVSASGAATLDLQKPLSAGERIEVKIDGKLTRLAQEAQTLEQAEQAVAELSEPTADGATFAVLDAVLSTYTSELSRELAREKELVAAHRAALATGSTERMELQSQLASQAGVSARARARLSTALGQRAAGRINRARGDQDPLSAAARALLDPSP